MRGYDLLTMFRKLTPKEQDDAIQWFLGGVGMEFEGFTDSKERPNYSKSEYALNHFEAAIWYARGVRINLPAELCEMELSKDSCESPDPLEVANVGKSFDWTPALLLALVVFVFVVLVSESEEFRR